MLYCKALINWQFANRSHCIQSTFHKCHNKYFHEWTLFLVNKSIVLATTCKLGMEGKVLGQVINRHPKIIMVYWIGQRACLLKVRLFTGFPGHRTCLRKIGPLLDIQPKEHVYLRLGFLLDIQAKGHVCLRFGFLLDIQAKWHTFLRLGF